MGIAHKFDNTLNTEVASLIAAVSGTTDSSLEVNPDSPLCAEVEKIAGIKRPEHLATQSTVFTTAFSDAEFLIGDDLQNQTLPRSRIGSANSSR